MLGTTCLLSLTTDGGKRRKDLSPGIDTGMGDSGTCSCCSVMLDLFHEFVLVRQSHAHTVYMELSRQ